MAEKNQKTDQAASAAITKLGNFNSVQEMMEWAERVIDSGLLPDSISEPEQVMTIVQHGKELGLTPHIALNNIHVIAGRPTVGASMLGAMLKKAGVEWIITRDFEQVEGDKENKMTTYKFMWKSRVTGGVLTVEHSVTWKQLILAGYTTKSNYKTFPKEMMRARCLSSGVRAYFPEILMGMYTDVEMSDVHGYNMTVTEDADVVLQD